LAVRRIVTVEDGDPVLRTAARPVRKVDRVVRALMDDMVETMRDAPGVGLAAPQVGVDLRVIVVEAPLEVEGDEPDADGPTRLHVLANPEIVWADPALEEGSEACLSVPSLVGDVQRHVACRIRGLSPSGRCVELAVRGFEARVFQHEIDHLEGRLFTDRVTSLDKLHGLEDVGPGAADRGPLEAAHVASPASI
jgi:peptide deformylase